MAAPFGGTIVTSPFGDRSIDPSGSPVSVIHVDPSQSYVGAPQLLQTYIDEGSAEAWSQIKAKIDCTYGALDRSLSELEKATGFAARVRDEVVKGKKVLFKPNLVYPANIDPVTHGPDGGNRACTDWTFMAAVMRWFHDKLGITYHQMCLGEGGSGTAGIPRLYTMHYSNGRTITHEAVTEGKSGDFYGGWGFYFARKYLAETHDSSHADDPMRGYEESVSGTYIPPGRARDRLMVYDTNRTYDDEAKARDVEVPDGANFRTITLHKVITGGNPDDPDDLRDYPGCVLVNVPKLKVHSSTLLTCAVKNIGIGLYPMQAADRDGPKGKRWKYGYPPSAEVPILKSQIPHNIWQLVTDPVTEKPIKDENGGYVFQRTAGINATMADAIKATEACGTTFIHVVDGIECINLDHTGLGPGMKVAEGLVIAGLDPVAVDLLCARYLFKTVPMAEARRLKEEGNLPGDFLQKVPVPRFDGQNIVTGEGYDSPIYRNRETAYMESRGVGKRGYHVIGWDLATGTPLASIEGHLGRVEAGKFVEVMTGTTYMDVPKFLWDMQATVMGYLAALDEMSGTSCRKALLELYDANGDGIIDLDETGKIVGTGGGAPRAEHIRATEKFGFLRGPFYVTSAGIKGRRADWNPDGIEVPEAARLGAFTFTALRLSLSPTERPDPFVPGLTFGKGKWPSLKLVEYLTMVNSLYGAEFPAKVGPSSLYGLALAYADKVLNGGTYTGSKGLATDPQAAETYAAAVAVGAKPLDFTLYVPRGWGSIGGRQLPNVEETDDPARVLTASFGHGKEVW